MSEHRDTRPAGQSQIRDTRQREAYMVSVSTDNQEHGVMIRLSHEEARVLMLAAAQFNEDSWDDPKLPTIGITPCPPPRR